MALITALIVGSTMLGPSAQARTFHYRCLVRCGQGYLVVSADGGVFAFGSERFAGSLAGQPLAAPVVAVLPAAPTAGYLVDMGYLLVDAAGHVSSFGQAKTLGDLRNVSLKSPIVAAAGDSAGYILVSANGGVFTFGQVRMSGNMGGRRLPAPIVGVDVTTNGLGYWLLDRQGHVYGFGNATQRASTAVPIPHPSPSAHVVGIAASGTTGYYVAWNDGTVIGYGTAHFSANPQPRLAASIVHIARAGGVSGIYLLGADGGVFALGGAGFFGSMAGHPLARPATAMYFMAQTRTSPPGSASCDVVATHRPTFPSVAQFEAAIEGRWFSCLPSSIFGTSELGLQINPDHTWKKVFGTIDSPEFSAGIQYSEGTWTTQGSLTPSWFQINFKLKDGGYFYEYAYMTPDSLHMHFNDGFDFADYVRWNP
jgi:hypothetical protein